MVTNWKKQLLDGAAEIFSTGRANAGEADEQLKAEPKQRWHDVGDVRIELEQVSEDPSGTLVLPVADVAQAAPQSKLPRLAAVVLGMVIASVAAWTLKPESPRPVSRHRHDLPEGIAFRNSGVNTIAVSPDGQYSVYNGAGGLYLRSRNELEARVIAGTEGAVTNPFFSRDSQWVGFWNREGRIEKIAINGGTPIPIGPAPDNPNGISWGADDIVLFSQSDGIYSVSANGGTPDRIIEARDGERLGRPTVLPSGREILFTAAPVGPRDNAEIVVASLDAPEDRTVVWNGSAASYAPTGHLIYALGNDLFAIAFDPDTLETSGTAVSLEQGLGRPIFGRESANYGMSEDGSLVYRVGRGPIQQRILVWVDSEGNETPVGAPIDDYSGTSVSPDGSRVALTISDGTQNDIWIWNFARQTPTRLTFDEANDGSPIWTPDSQQIIFRSERDGLSNIYHRRADGTGTVEQLTEGTGTKFPESLSSDGATLAFDQYSGGTTRIDILMLGLGSGTSGEANREPVMWLQTEFSEANPMISPDGQWVAYESNDSGVNEIYVRPFADIEAGKWQVSRAGGGNNPLWSPDGQWLYYRSNSQGVGNNQMMRVAIDTDTAIEFGNPEPVFDDPIVGGRISPDGRFLLIRDAEVETEPFRPHIITVLNWFEELKERVPVP